MRSLDLLFRLALVLLVSVSAVADEASETAEAREVEAGTTWPQWRGPTRDGAFEGDPWPDDLGEEALRRAWRVEAGPSYSGPVIAADRVFITETIDAKSERVRALSTRDGAVIWETEWEGSLSVPFFARANGSWIRSTPAYDGEHLFVGGMRDVLVALDASTGDVEWRVDFPAIHDSPLPAFGFVSSPLVHDEHIYVQAGGGLAKLRKEDGEVVWKVLRDGGGMYGSAFSSPVVAEIHGREQLVVQTRSELAGVDAGSGELLWSHEIAAFRGMNILTPTIFGNRVFTSTYGGGTFCVEIRRGDQEGIFETEQKWRAPAEGYMTSPALVGKHAYLHMKSTRLVCFDVETGERSWTSGERFGKYMSLVHRGERILALDERGVLVLFEADPTAFRAIATRRVSDDSTWAHLGVCNGRLYVRELHAVTAFDWTRPTEAQE